MKQSSFVLFMGLALLLGGVGCQPGQEAKTFSYRLSPFELAQRLRLDITEQTDRYFEMKNGANRVIVFIHDGGRVFVNQTPVGITGPVTHANGTIYVPEILESTIRPHLRSQYLPPQVQQPKWTPPTVIPHKADGLIVIDAGHGGKDPGAISYLGYYEKNVTLRIASKLAAILKARGYQVKMIRESDVYIDKYDRAEITNRIGPDLFISIHCDANEKRSIHGYSVWVSRSASQASRRTAAFIETAMSKSKTGISSRGVREADYVVLANTRCPAVLVECGHISNPQEAAQLYDGKYQDRIAAAVADGIVEAMKKM
ncbi:MAG: N-acetylmuramoyl-L-alanine amidase [Sedimentisphaerales bacterium]|nr:N-acetylmuramoyl-L-alanine amidase [Sedimentisphaerales bacterium]